MTAMRRLLPLLLVLSGCEFSSTDPLPEGYNPESTREFTIRADVTIVDDQDRPVPIRTLGGYDGGPETPDGVTVDAFYQRSGVKVVRFPRGWQCDVTLDQVFPSVLADPESTDSYRFTDLEAMAKGFVSHGMLPIWQALYDVGSGACRADGPVGRSDPIGDPVLWSQAVVGTLEFLNRKVAPYFKDETYAARIAEVGLNPGYVEVLPDPMACCGYANLGLDYLLPAYGALFEALDQSDQADPGTRILDLVAPSFRVAAPSDLSDEDAPMARFLDFVAQETAGRGPQVLSLLSTTASPDDQAALVKALKDRAGTLGLQTTRVADLGMRVDPAVWTARAADLDTTAKRSMWLGAFLAMARILDQETLELLVPDRWGGPAAEPGDQAGEDLFQAANGNGLPAFHTMVPFFLMDLGKAVRVAVDTIDDTAGPRDLRVLAGRKEDGALAVVIVALPTPDDPRVGYRLTYRLDLRGLDGDAYTLRRAVIDAGSTDFRYSESSRVAPVDGALAVARQIIAPSVQYLELNPAQ